mmetsp:Transcript_42956/g.130715  ORF Transcript_42956/g.130715 Transcript_42956/m.130715 type:complete len:519 (-) Transcript_42956:125-1681(-)
MSTENGAPAHNTASVAKDEKQAGQCTESEGRRLTGSGADGEDLNQARRVRSSIPNDIVQRQRRAEEAQRSVAYAGALVGEAVMNPPIPSPPHSGSAVAAAKGSLGSGGQRVAYRHSGNRMDRTGGRSGDFDDDEDEDDDYEEVEYDDADEGPGIIGTARNWWARRQEIRRQAELARQVELQRRKLQLEARMRDKAKMTQKQDNTLVHDTGSSALEAKLQAMTGGRMDRRVASEAAWGTGGVIAGICGVGSGDEEYGISRSGSVDTDDSFYASDNDSSTGGGSKRKMRISHAKQTLSGDGMAVAVELPDDDDDDENFSKVIVVPEKSKSKDSHEVSPFLLSEAQMRQIASRVLPPALMLCRWKRLYSLARDGDSFDNFLRLMEGTGRSLLVIRTTVGELFGAYSDSPYEAKHHGAAAASFYGSAQACLWRILPANGEVKAYKWSGMNRYIQLVDVRSKMLAFGGGGNAGEFGLCVEDDFRRGSTGTCGTFGNEPLCDHADGGSFEVVDVECWGFLSGFC